MIRNADFTKIDNIRAKLIHNPSSGNIFDTSMKIKRDSSNKVLYENMKRKTEKNISNDSSIQLSKNDLMKRNNSNVNIRDYMKNSVIKGKMAAKNNNSNSKHYNKN